MGKIAKDRRNKLWSVFEKEIQARAKKKDNGFLLKGKWKKFINKEKGYKIFSVDGSWVRKNLCVYFGHGGHGFVHEFIPLDEIWVSSHHYEEWNSAIVNCGCKRKSGRDRVSKNYFNSTVLHEIVECESMKQGKNYWRSHLIAMEAERKAGLIKSPFNDE